MPLFSRKKTSVGLDIGSGLIKVAVVDHGNTAPELVRVSITKLPPDAIVEGEVMDPGIVADAIRASLDAASVKSRHVVTAVGGRDVMIKKIQTERVKDKQARELMRWEAEQHVPDVESVELDFQILDSGKTSEEMSVLLVAAKRDLIDSKLRILAEAGVTPTIVDVNAFAQVRAVYLCGGGSRTPGLDELLGKRLGVPVQHANPLARLNIRDGAFENYSTDEVAPLLMLPIGLALRQ